MVILLDKYQDIFEGISQVKVALTYIEVDQGTKPMTEKQIQVLIVFMELLKQH